MQRVMSWLAVLFFAGCLALGYLAFAQRSEIKQLDVRWGEAQKRTEDLQRQIALSRTARDEPASHTSRASAEPAADRTASASSTGGLNIIHIADILKAHPEYTAAYEKIMRRNINRTYGDTLNSLNLAPDRLAQLKNLLAERQMDNVDAQSAAEAAGLARGSPEWQAAMTEAAQSDEQQITAILGANADATLARLATQAGIQRQVQDNYAADFSDAGVPLTPGESTGLTQAMADANYAGKDTSTRPANYNVVDAATGLSPHDERILSNAAAVLSPAQLQVLKTDQVENEQEMAVRRQYGNGNGQVVFVP